MLATTNQLRGLGSCQTRNKVEQLYRATLLLNVEIKPELWWRTEIVDGLIAIPASLYLTPNTQNTRGSWRKFRVPAGFVECRCLQASTTVSSLLLFGIWNQLPAAMSLCTLPSRPSSLDCWASRRLTRQFRDIRPVFILYTSTFLPVCGTCIYRLLPALHAHLPCTTLLNSEECALSEKKKKNKLMSVHDQIQHNFANAVNSCIGF